MRAAVVLSLIVSLQTAPSIAGGLFGDALNVIVPGAGTALDDAHRDFKEQVPVYGDVEEGLADGVRKGFEELNGEVDGPILANWIWASRQDVINAGVEPLPPYIYEAMQGYFPEHILQKVRWRTGWGNEIALPALSFRFGDAAAITLDEIVMFRDWDDAQGNLALWAHELTHVVQYDQWGVMDFAKRYVKDYGGVEGEAEDNAGRFLTWYNMRQQTAEAQFPQFPGQEQSIPQQSNRCQTHMGACMIPDFGPVGVSCWCGTPWGPVYGALMP